MTPQPLRSVEIARIDPRLFTPLSGLFSATFPGRRAELGEADADGRYPLTVAPPWSLRDRERWSGGLQLLLEQPFARERGAYVREVRDRSGTRLEVALPQSVAEYRGGAWLVGPFRSEAETDGWARSSLTAGWVHDLHAHAGRYYADVFYADPEVPLSS